MFSHRRGVRTALPRGRSAAGKPAKAYAIAAEWPGRARPGRSARAHAPARLQAVRPARPPRIGRRVFSDA